MIRIGIVGTGRIAARFLTEIAAVEGITVVCVYNPNRGSAERFAHSGGVPFYTDRLDELAERSDSVYIASPHESHFEYAKEFLQRKKHVLCEKPLALKGADARELFRLAKENGCVLMEAVKTAWCPGFLAMMETAKSGIIGRIQDVEACFTRLTPTNVRELVDRDYGGSFTELGTYVMLPILQLLGTEFEDVHFRSLRAGNGVDGYTKAEFVYPDACGLAKTGLLVKSEGQLVIAGTKGYILAKSPWWLTKEFEVRFEDSSRQETYTFEFEGAGLRYEIAAFVRAIDTSCFKKMEASLSEADIRMRESGVEMEAVSVCMADIMEKFLQQERTGREMVRTADVKPENIRIWAHRGMSYAWPENTLPAFEAAAKLEGLTGIELDVQLTRDKELVVIHDEQVDRTTEGSGAVGDFTLAEIKRLKLKGITAEDVGIPALEEVLDLLYPYCTKRGLLINIELKNSQVRYEGMEAKVLKLVEEKGLKPWVWYSSFLPDSLDVIRKIEPEAQIGVLAPMFEDCMAWGERLGADALHPYTGGLNVNLAERWKGKPVRAWAGGELFFGQKGVFQEKDMTRYGQFGVTDVFTNVPECYI